ncbi:MAG: M28 family peptidase, partial [Nitrospiraceae bacterium]
MIRRSRIFTSYLPVALRFSPALPFILILGGCLKTMQPLNPSELPLSSQAAQRLSTHVQFLASPVLAGREPGTIGNRKAADYIEATFREAHLHSFPSMSGFRQIISSRLGDNVLAFTPSVRDSGRWILIGAHYDHLGGQYLGADDNSSSIAIVIELASRLRSLSNYSVVFVAFNTEEHPYFGTPLMGSEYFLRHLPPEIGSQDTFQAVVIMDLMGGVQWAPTRDVIFAAGAEKSPGLYRRVKEAVAPQPSFVNREDGHMTPHASRLTVLPVGMHLVEEIPDHGHEAFSDYDAFRNRNIPFLFLSTARTPRYHTPHDR